MKAKALSGFLQLPLTCLSAAESWGRSTCWSGRRGEVSCVLLGLAFLWLHHQEAAPLPAQMKPKNHSNLALHTFFPLLSFFFNFFLWESQEHGVKGGTLSQVKSRRGQQGHFSRGSGLEGLRQTQRRKRKGCHDHGSGHGSPLREERFSSRPQEGQDTDPAASACPTAAAGSDRAPQVFLHPTHQAGVPRKGTWTRRGPAKPVREERVEPASVCRAAPLELKWLLLPAHTGG